MALYKKKNRWYTDLYDSDGRRIRQSVNIEGKAPSEITRKDAMKVEAIRKADLAKGIKLETRKNKISFSYLVEKYLEWVDQNRKSNRTDHSICKILLEFFPNKKVENFTLFDIERLKKYLKDQGRKPETINKYLGTFRRMMNLAIDWKLINKNPLKGMKLLKVPVKKYEVFSDNEVEILINLASKHFKPILLTFYFTGMRVSEIQHLKWKDVDFEKGYITVSESKNNEYRTIPINDVLITELKILHHQTTSEFVFLTPKGNPYKGNTPFKTVWNNTLKKAGIGHYTLHCFRHTFVSNLIVNQKEDFATVMALSGHKDIKMLKRYSHTREEAKKSAIKKINFNPMKNTNNLTVVNN